MKMWILGLSIASVLVIYVFHLIFNLKNSKFSSTSSLPPGSMGLPFIGETIQFMIPSYSLDLHTFFKKRIQRFGPIFRTRLFGQPIVISVDPEVNSYLVQQEGKLVGLFLGPLSKVFAPDGDQGVYASEYFQKCFRSLTLTHVGSECIREKLLPQLEEMAKEALHMWSTQTSVEVYESSSIMVFHFFAKHYFGYDAQKLPESGRIAEQLFTTLSKVFLTIPLNIPGTTFHKCLKETKKAFTIMKNIMEERRKSSPKSYRGDFLDQVINDMRIEKILTEDQNVYLVLGVWFATCLAMSSMLTLIFMFLSEYPSVIEELRVEHEEIIKARDKSSSSSLTWDEYKSMKFTQQVINEALRFTILIPGVLRTAIKDIQVKEYTIPAGWTILLATQPLHMNSKIYEDPLTFNPHRWKDLDSYTISKNFKPFGGGLRQCPGAELTRAIVATFLHVLVTQYKWTKIKGGSVFRNPVLGFGDGIHIKLEKKNI